MPGHPNGIGRVLIENLRQCEELIAERAERPDVPQAHLRAQLRAQLPTQGAGELERLIRGVARLQKQAVAKLTPPDSPKRVWWVTERSLQQATPWQVATLKSGWFGSEPVHDLCCGVGGDSLSLATRGELTAVDLDPVIAAMAEANLAVAGYEAPRASVRCADVTELQLPKGMAIHIDPDRRPGGQRQSDPAACRPAWTDVSRMVAGASAAVIKLAPAAAISEQDLDVGQIHRVWIALQGTVREQSVLWGAAVDAAGVTRGNRSAAIVRADQTTTWFVPDHDSVSTAPADHDAPREFLVDPNAAIRAAGLTESFATQYGLGCLSGPAGFLTGDADAGSDEALQRLAVTGCVEWWGACDDRKLRKELRTRGVYPEVIKVRGTDHDPAALAKRYRKCGERPITLWIGRTGKRVFAAITN